MDLHALGRLGGGFVKKTKPRSRIFSWEYEYVRRTMKTVGARCGDALLLSVTQPGLEFS